MQKLCILAPPPQESLCNLGSEHKKSVKESQISYLYEATHYTLSFSYAISGFESFEGRHFHSWEYRSADGMEGKTVVVIGIGNSGGDIAVDISRVAEKVLS